MSSYFDLMGTWCYQKCLSILCFKGSSEEKYHSVEVRQNIVSATTAAASQPTDGSATSNTSSVAVAAATVCTVEEGASGRSQKMDGGTSQSSREQCGGKAGKKQLGERDTV